MTHTICKIIQATTVALVLNTIANSAQAFTLPNDVNGQLCRLGDTCPIPASDGGLTYYEFNKQMGEHYKCSFVKDTTATTSSDNGLFSIFIYGGKGFNIRQGLGPHIISTSPATIDIGGYFSPDEDAGQIKISRISGSGKVTCIKA